MTKQDNLLTHLSEECAELSQRAAKALRFGLKETQIGHTQNNARRIRYEFADLLGVYEMLVQEGLLTNPSRKEINDKKKKIVKYLKYSKKQGTLE